MSGIPGACPQCKSERIARIIYGSVNPDEKMMKDLDKGKIVLGGCVVSGNDPEWQCLACDYQWGLVSFD